MAPDQPGRDCPLCPRLLAYRAALRQKHPSWFNAPVPSFLPLGGAENVQLLIVGLAPGISGANRTGRPFTGDAAGEILYKMLALYGFLEGVYQADPADGIILRDTAITNAVRCVPPQNKPTTKEINTCRRFLLSTLQTMPYLRTFLCLGRTAHASLLRGLGLRLAAFPFAHAADYDLPSASGIALRLISSYHPSRYNLNTGRLTEAMFQDIFEKVKASLCHAQSV